MVIMPSKFRVFITTFYFCFCIKYLKSSFFLKPLHKKVVFCLYRFPDIRKTFMRKRTFV